jgi:hypothetical protein
MKSKLSRARLDSVRALVRRTIVRTVGAAECHADFEDPAR